MSGVMHTSQKPRKKAASILLPSHRCKICTSRYAHPAGLKAHMISKHPDEMEKTKEPAKEKAKEPTNEKGKETTKEKAKEPTKVKAKETTKEATKETKGKGK